MNKTKTEWTQDTAIKDWEDSLIGARHEISKVEIPIYDDGFGPLWIHRDSLGISGIVRAKSWSEAYSICEDEFFPEADETIDELVKEYGFKVEHVKIVKGIGDRHDHERPAIYPDDYPDGSLATDLEFVRWDRIETPNSKAWSEHPEFCEAFGFRPNGPNSKDKVKHGIYAKDLNRDSLEPLAMNCVRLGIEIQIEHSSDDDNNDILDEQNSNYNRMIGDSLKGRS